MDKKRKDQKKRHRKTNSGALATSSAQNSRVGGQASGSYPIQNSNSNFKIHGISFGLFDKLNPSKVDQKNTFDCQGETKSITGGQRGGDKKMIPEGHVDGNGNEQSSANLSTTANFVFGNTGSASCLYTDVSHNLSGSTFVFGEAGAFAGRYGVGGETMNTSDSQSVDDNGTTPGRQKNTITGQSGCDGDAKQTSTDTQVNDLRFNRNTSYCEVFADAKQTTDGDLGGVDNNKNPTDNRAHCQLGGGDDKHTTNSQGLNNNNKNSTDGQDGGIDTKNITDGQIGSGDDNNYTSHYQGDGGRDNEKKNTLGGSVKNKNIICDYRDGVNGKSADVQVGGGDHSRKLSCGDKRNTSYAQGGDSHNGKSTGGQGSGGVQSKKAPGGPVGCGQSNKLSDGQDGNGHSSQSFDDQGWGSCSENASGGQSGGGRCKNTTDSEEFSNEDKGTNSKSFDEDDEHSGIKGSPTKQSPKSFDKKKKRRTKDSCDIHKSKEAAFYCPENSRYICTTCILDDRNVEADVIHKHRERVEDDLKHMKLGIEKQMRKCKSNIESLHHDQQEIRKSTANINTRVDEQVKRLSSKIKSIGEDIKNYNGEASDKNNEQINKHSQKLKACKSELEFILTRIKNSIASTSVRNMTESLRKLQKEIENQEEQGTLLEFPELQKVEFSEAELDEFRITSLMDMLGTLVIYKSSLWADLSRNNFDEIEKVEIYSSEEKNEESVGLIEEPQVIDDTAKEKVERVNREEIKGLVRYEVTNQIQELLQSRDGYIMMQELLNNENGRRLLAEVLGTERGSMFIKEFLITEYNQTLLKGLMSAESGQVGLKSFFYTPFGKTYFNKFVACEQGFALMSAFLNTETGVRLIFQFLVTEKGLSLVENILPTQYVLPLVSKFIPSEVGKSLVEQFISNPDGISLLKNFLLTLNGRQLIKEFLPNQVGRILVKEFLIGGVGRNLLKQILTEQFGLSLIKEFIITSPQGKALLQDLLNTTVGLSEIRKWVPSNTGNVLLRQTLKTDQGLALVREFLDTNIGRALLKERLDADRPTYIENIEMLNVQSLPWLIEYKPGNTNLSIILRLAMSESDYYLNWVLVNFSLILENNINDEESIRLENIRYRFKPGSAYMWSDVIPLTVLDNPKNGYLNESGKDTVTVCVDLISYNTTKHN
ncbi:hypothetical protein SNE40_016153 [Patella caerulea]|uniref:B box-type domain-containing protein n=1 Tax=Patella caerulea TaxID=87958 RepID=A0AAN8J887_PATCE